MGNPNPNRNHKRDWSVNRDAVKALVTVYGPREAARQAGLPAGTVFTWCRRFKWKKAEHIIRSTGINGALAGTGKDAGDMLTDAMRSHKEQSSLNLAKFTENASRKAAKHKDPLSVARQVRDVAQVYRAVFPVEAEAGIIEEGILVGNLKVTDNPQEMLNSAVIEADVREELPNQ